MLPAGAALPFGKDNPDGIHYAGLTQLLLSPPTDSTPDSKLKLEKDEVVSVGTFLEEYESGERPKMQEQFTNEGLRQIVGRGWTTPTARAPGSTCSASTPRDSWTRSRAAAGT